MLANFGGVSKRYSPEFIRPDENLRVPDVGKFVQIKPDWEVLGDVRQKVRGTNVKYPFPAIVNDDTKGWGWRVFDIVGRNVIYYPMPDQWQRFLWDFWNWNSGYRLPTGEILEYYEKKTNSGIFARCTPGSMTWLYVDMIEVSRAWTDAWNVEQGGRDVVTGRNLTAKKPYEWLLRPCTGHMLKVIREDSVYYYVSAINLDAPPPPMSEVEKHPEWVCWATQVHVEKYTSRFPQIKEAFAVHGYPVQGTAIPLLAPRGEGRIKKSACTPLQNGAAWSPYVQRQGV